jgi:hypothetical protein
MMPTPIAENKVLFIPLRGGRGLGMDGVLDFMATLAHAMIGGSGECSFVGRRTQVCHNSLQRKILLSIFFNVKFQFQNLLSIFFNFRF